MPAAGETLISIDEAEEVVQTRTGPFTALRTPILIAVGACIIVVFSLFVMIILSLRGARTGVEAALPFLDKQAIETLQEP